jgi:protein-S-isoprenylcysteine O-methyltransferase Ste14
MRVAGWIVLMASWAAWWYPFIFHAPHYQKRPSITARGPTLAGLLLEVTAIFLAFACRLPPDTPPGFLRIAGTAVFGLIAAVLAWTSVVHLGKQFRVNAGLYEDHELVNSGPYAIVRHPIYSSLLGMLLSTLCLGTGWQWAVLSLGLFVAGTEIRVHTEDRLLASRFDGQFAAYRKKVPAYVPFVR